MRERKERKPFTLYLGNLSPFVTKCDVVRFFSAEGFSVGFINLVKTNRETGEPLERCSAFVVLNEPEQAMEAREKLNNRKMFDREVIVRRFNRKAALPASSAPAPLTPNFMNEVTR